jgi:hypothetical protein
MPEWYEPNLNILDKFYGELPLSNIFEIRCVVSYNKHVEGQKLSPCHAFICEISANMSLK